MWSKLPLSSNIVTPGRSATVCRTDRNDNARYVNDRDIVATVYVSVTYPSRPLPRLFPLIKEVWKVLLYNTRFTIFQQFFSPSVYVFIFVSISHDFYLTKRNPRSFSRYFESVEIRRNIFRICQEFLLVYLSILDLFIYLLLPFVSRLVLFVYLFRFCCLKTCFAFVFIYIYFSAYSYITQPSDLEYFGIHLYNY